MPAPAQHTTISPLTTFLITSFFLLALFPGLFVAIAWAPYNALVAWAFSAAAVSKNLARENCAPTMSWSQKTFTLPPKSRGCYLVTPQITSALPELSSYRTGLLHLFVQHTSCALSLNENWDSDVRVDMADAMDRIVPRDDAGKGLYRHDAEGADDMPAHIKSALIGASITVPITNGKLALGTWQGIWYFEFRDAKHTRKVVATIQGEKM